MKNNFIYTALWVLTVLLFASCSKDNSQPANIPPADLKVYRQVKLFREQLKSGLKNAPMMSADSAIWYIETTLNLTYGSASFPFERMNLDTFYVQMPVNADSVSFADVQQAYESLFGNITAQYHAMAAENKQFIFCHLRPLENQLKNGSETWEMVSGVGEGPINLLTFGPNDYWIWWNQSPNQSGICDGPAYPGGYGSDAAEEIEIKVHLRKAMPCGYYSCINPVVIKAVAWDFPNSNQTSPNMYSSYLFDNLSYLPNFHFCLSPEEMNFYLNGAERIIYNPSPTGAKPEGLSFVSIDMQGDLLLLPDFISNPTHIAYITYATLITNPNPPLNL